MTGRRDALRRIGVGTYALTASTVFGARVRTRARNGTRRDDHGRKGARRDRRRESHLQEHSLRRRHGDRSLHAAAPGCALARHTRRRRTGDRGGASHGPARRQDAHGSTSSIGPRLSTAASERPRTPSTFRSRSTMSPSRPKSSAAPLTSGRPHSASPTSCPSSSSRSRGRAARPRKSCQSGRPTISTGARQWCSTTTRDSSTIHMAPSGACSRRSRTRNRERRRAWRRCDGIAEATWLRNATVPSSVTARDTATLLDVMESGPDRDLPRRWWSRDAGPTHNVLRFGPWQRHFGPADARAFPEAQRAGSLIEYSRPDR